MIASSLYTPHYIPKNFLKKIKGACFFFVSFKKVQQCLCTCFPFLFCFAFVVLFSIFEDNLLLYYLTKKIIFFITEKDVNKIVVLTRAAIETNRLRLT